ncbi:polysaccharide pyruvyl transferase family protein [Dysgonomonas sp. ZJ279]|uniref:polysaccharide pyruvyl transferase family protein n=1 Tax=Dysgonomonas sp. ZJ279 TaxID=2709796 RepID=UPI0013EDC9FA|nr:polysaccharide pyruvyl transferase family protein [Dysgonomonas sp. ZJ279]
MNKKTIGIITMHKVLNYGSVFQAYALQKYLETHGFDNDLIDYLYPNEYNKQFHKQSSLLSKLKNKILEIVLGNPRKRKSKRFENFYETHFKLSPEQYNSKKSIHENPPQYDVYITGSDQVWNTKYIGDDTSFLLSFAPEEQMKISYASSFASSSVDDKYKELYKKYLAQYNHLSVREKEGVQILKNAMGLDGQLVLDPTFLLKSQDWNILANKSELPLPKSYILVYVLDYAYNPYPYVTNLIKAIQIEMNMEVVVLDMVETQLVGAKHILRIRDAGPYDFLKLFRDATFVVTTSFHGIAFSLNYSKPFYAVLNDENTGDNRMFNILKLVGAEDRALVKNSPFPSFSDMSMDYTVIQKNMDLLREQSSDFLLKSLTDSDRK